MVWYGMLCYYFEFEYVVGILDFLSKLMSRTSLTTRLKDLLVCQQAIIDNENSSYERRRRKKKKKKDRVIHWAKSIIFCALKTNIYSVNCVFQSFVSEITSYFRNQCVCIREEAFSQFSSYKHETRFICLALTYTKVLLRDLNFVRNQSVGTVITRVPIQYRSQALN